MQVKNILFVFLLFAALGAFGQDTIALKDYAVQVNGTSTLHAWTVNVNNANGFILSNDSGIPTTVHLEFEVESMDGGRGAAMNDKIKKALKASTDPWIIFDSRAIVQDEGGGWKVEGDLDIGGILQPVNLMVAQSDKIYTAVVDLTFSMFEIEPPSAMFGQIKCGDNLSISLELTY